MSAAQNVQQKVQSHPAFQQAQTKASYYVGQLDKELTKYPVLNNLENKTQIPKVYGVLGVVFVLSIFHTINPLAAPVSNLIGWALPAYLSFKALETPGAQDDVQWLTYWVVFGFFNFLESFALSLVLYYLPWYFAFKSIFVLWLQLPAFRGAQVVYLNALKPILANVTSARSGAISSHSQFTAEPTVTADQLRDRVATATQD